MKAANDLTVGKPLKVILFFAIPIFIGNIFQQFYNIVDMVVVGHVMGDEALAAIGASSVIYTLIISMANGMTSGFSIVVARLFGGKKFEQMRQAMAITIILTIIISAVLTIISALWLRPFLELLNTPEVVIGQADAYIRIIMMAVTITMTYNMFAGILRAIGNSTAPLIFLVISCLINIVLVILFVKGLGMGIRGAAYATVISQAISVALSIFYILKKCPILRLERKDFKYDRAITLELSATGFSMALMLSIVSIGTVALQSAINGFGTLTIAAHTSARKIGEIFMLPLGTLTLAASTFVSQNYGAGKMDRIRQGIKGSFILAFIWCTFSTIVVVFGAKILIQLITGTSEEVVLNTAATYMYINIPFYYLLSILVILRSTLQGIGKKLIPIAASLIELSMKFVVAAILAPRMGYLGICIAEPMIWIMCAIMVSIDFYRVMNKLTDRSNNAIPGGEINDRRTIE